MSDHDRIQLNIEKNPHVTSAVRSFLTKYDVQDLKNREEIAHGQHTFKRLGYEYVLPSKGRYTDRIVSAKGIPVVIGNIIKHGYTVEVHLTQGLKFRAIFAFK